MTEATIVQFHGATTIVQLPIGEVERLVISARESDCGLVYLQPEGRPPNSVCIDPTAVVALYRA